MDIQPKEIRKLGGKELKIIWGDEHESLYAFRFLRQSCKCAFCVDERTGQGILNKEQVNQDLEGLKVSIVGQYALRVDFSDGHNTGLFTFRYLRELCP